MAYVLGTKFNVTGTSAFYTEADGAAFELQITIESDVVRPFGWDKLPKVVVGGLQARGRITLFVDAKPAIPTGTVMTVVFTANTGVTYTLKGVFTQLSIGGAGSQATAAAATYEFIGGGTASTDTIS
jgi:hypothetical protein